MLNPFYNTINKPNNAIEAVGIAIITPYLTKSRNENLTSYLLSNEVNIIPAKAPIGVKNAPMLLPIILEYMAFNASSSGNPLGKFENKMLIGILLIKLEASNEEYPYTQIGCP